MKFKAPGDQPMMIALTSGHTTVVSPEGNEIPDRFNREALSRGCIPVGMAIDSGEAPSPLFDRPAVIRAAIEEMVEKGDSEDFNQDGKPNLLKLKARVGFQVERVELDPIWAAMEVEADGP